MPLLPLDMDRITWAVDDDEPQLIMPDFPLRLEGLTREQRVEALDWSTHQGCFGAGYEPQVDEHYRVDDVGYIPNYMDHERRRRVYHRLQRLHAEAVQAREREAKKGEREAQKTAKTMKAMKTKPKKTVKKTAPKARKVQKRTSSRR